MADRNIIMTQEDLIRQIDPTATDQRVLDIMTSVPTQQVWINLMNTVHSMDGEEALEGLVVKEAAISAYLQGIGVEGADMSALAKDVDPDITDEHIDTELTTDEQKFTWAISEREAYNATKKAVDDAVVMKDLLTQFEAGIV